MVLGSLSTPGSKVSAAIGVGGILTGNAKATLTPEAGGIPVVFGLNPESVSIQKVNHTEGRRGVVASSVQEALRGTGNIRWTVSGAHLFGAATTKPFIDSLVGWATPERISAETALELGSVSAVNNLISEAKSLAEKTAAAGGEADRTTLTSSMTLATPVYYRLPILLFSWGLVGPMGANTRVTLETVTVKYKRFDDYGIPVWATADLKMVEYVEDKPFTNPTSGGVPGHNRHVVTQGENVVHIANRVYGSPGAWRAVAEANHIDDPLRVRPGRRLALPPAGQTQEVATR